MKSSHRVVKSLAKRFPIKAMINGCGQTGRRRMLYRNAPWILLLVCIFLVLVIYTVDDRSSTTPVPSQAKLEGGRGAHHLDPSPARFIPSTSKDTRTMSAVHPSPLVFGKNKTRLKTILYWNEFYGRYDTYDFGYGRQAFLDNQCKVSTCFATQDRSLLPIEQFDAIIIHIRGLPNDLPAKRGPKQRYIMLSIEAPIYLFEYRDLNRLHFNWTMTYRLDSDFPIPYAWIDNIKALPAPLGSNLLQRFIVRHGKEAASQGPNLAEGKIGLAVQFVSNCHSASHREHYVRELQKHIPIDIYGKCGHFKCPKEKGMACFQMAEKKYKFYLAFENALCKDFATEKFFTMYNLNMIPVVLGGANYSNFAPPHSFINAADFDSPKALAHYLKILDSDDAKFNEYFWWRDFYKRQFHHHQSICDVCEQLHANDRESIYSDMQDWWVKQAECTNAFSRTSLRDYY